MSHEIEWLAYDRAVLKRLQGAWAHLNHTYLRGALRPCVLELFEGTTQLGRWSRGRRVLGISRDLARSAPWEQVVDVLKHEMAHQWAHEVLGAVDERAHGEAFRRGCERLCVAPTATGAPQGSEEDPVLGKVRKLLALAASDNQHEAEVAMARAQELMLRHALEPATPAGMAVRTVGPRKMRFQTWESMICSLLVEHFFVEGIWIRVWLPDRQQDGRVFELIGRPHHVEIAAHAHDFLREASERLWREHKRSRGLRSDRERQTFLLGVVLGFRDKLRRQQQRSAETGLVWVGDADVRDYFDRRYPSVVQRGAVSYRNSPEHAAGRAAGAGLVLHRPITGESGPSMGALTDRSRVD